MSTAEEIFIAQLDADRQKKKDEAIRERENDVARHREQCSTELDEKLKPLETIKLEELDRIRRQKNDKIDGINRMTWEENQEFLRKQKLLINKKQEEVEEDLDSTKEYYEGELKRGSQKIENTEKKRNEAEKNLDEINERITRVPLDETTLTEDLRKEHGQERRKLEMEQIRVQMESSNKNLESKAEILANLNDKEAEIHEQTVCHRKNFIAENLHFLQANTRMSLLNHGSNQINAVNDLIDKLKKSANEMRDSTLDCSEILDKCVRARNSEKNEKEAEEMETSLVEVAESSTSRRDRREVKPKVKKEELKRLNTLLSNTRKQMGDLRSDVNDIEKKMSRLSPQEKLSAQFKEIKNQILEAEGLIFYFESFAKDCQYDWEEEKVNGFKALTGTIMSLISNLNPLPNDKRKEQEALLENQAKRMFKSLN